MVNTYNQAIEITAEGVTIFDKDANGNYVEMGTGTIAKDAPFQIIANVEERDRETLSTVYVTQMPDAKPIHWTKYHFVENPRIESPLIEE